MTKQTKVLFAASMPTITNGYSYAAYNLAKHLATKKDIDLTYWGFQCFNPNPEHVKLRQLPKNVTIYDAFAKEEPKHMGFGFDQIAGYVGEHKPDVIIIYNDFVVVSTILEKLKTCTHKDYKMIIYIDQVYLSQKKEYIKRLNDEADFVITFTPYWDQIIKEQGMNKPSDFLQHGFDPMRNYPVPKKLARSYFGLRQDDFIVINTNRNQPRKRYDITMIAWAEFVSRHQNEPVKLLIGTHPTQGSWNLIEIYERELRLRGMTLEEGMKHIILIDNPQQLSDDEVNILYNVADIGLNTTMGAGFELTNFEHGGMGFPQIAPYIGGIRDFLDPSCAKVVTPSLNIYTDVSNDGAPGCAEIAHPNDFVDALEAYYADEDLRKEHGQKLRQKIPKKYNWTDLGEKFYGIIKKVAGVTEEQTEASNDTISLDDIASLEQNMNIKTMETAKEGRTKIPVVVEDDEEPEKVPSTPETVSPPPSTPSPPPKASPQARKDDVKNRLKKKLEDKKKKVELSELLKLKKQLDALKTA